MITNPISSSQVTKVTLLKPDCLNICGDTLNDWLKALAEKHCEVDWKTVDTSCLESMYGNLSCEKDLKSIIELLIDSMCKIETANQGCGGSSSNCNCPDPQEAAVTFYDRWTNVSALNGCRVFLKDNVVYMKGRISGGTILGPLFNIPADFRPAFERRVPFAFAFTPHSGTAHPSLQILPNGNVTIVWAGSSPSTSLLGDVFLDGVSFVK